MPRAFRRDHDEWSEVAWARMHTLQGNQPPSLIGQALAELLPDNVVVFRRFSSPVAEVSAGLIGLFLVGVIFSVETGFRRLDHSLEGVEPLTSPGSRPRPEPGQRRRRWEHGARPQPRTHKDIGLRKE